MSAMKAVSILLLCFLAAAQGRSLLVTDGETPESPKFEVKNSTKALEIREYENATWAVAFGRSRWSVDLAAQTAGVTLARYFGGGNVDHEFIDPTIPVFGTVLGPHPPPHHHNKKNDSHHGNDTDHKPPHHKPHHGPHGPPRGPPAVALAAYIPSKYEGKAPIPDSPHVRIVKTNSTKAYVHKFGGWAISWVVKHEIKHLVSALKDIDICPKKGIFLVATYDAPWKVFGRHNEIVWVKRPHHKHHNESHTGEDQVATGLAESMGMEALDVESLFPEEFPPADRTEAQSPASGAELESTQGGKAVDPKLMLENYFNTKVIDGANVDTQIA